MVGILDKTTAQKAAIKIDGSGKCQHKCAQDHELHIGEFEADLLTKYDPSLMKHLKSIGIKIIKIEITDLDLVGELIDEVNNQLGKDHNDDDKYLYKHAITVRLNATLLSTINSYYADQNQVCSNIFGNRIDWYK